MATTEVMNTTVMTISVNASVIGDCVDASLQFSHSPRNITNKQDAGWRRLAEGMREWSLNASFMYIPDHTDYDFADVFGLLTARTTGTGRLTSTASGDAYFEGAGWLGSGNLASNGVEDNVMADFALEGSDALTSGATT